MVLFTEYFQKSFFVPLFQLNKLGYRKLGALDFKLLRSSYARSYIAKNIKYSGIFFQTPRYSYEHNHQRPRYK